MRATLEQAGPRLRARLAGWRARSKRIARPAAGRRDLEARVERLEDALEALQDSTYRQDVVHDRKIAELRHEHGERDR